MAQPTIEFARKIRINALQMVHAAKASHIGGAFSMADILAVLYGSPNGLRVNPEQPNMEFRDRFLLSKGHSCVGLYSALALSGFFPIEELQSYAKDGSRLMSHISHKVPGAEFSTGSLGHALPVASGMALACRSKSQSWNTVALLSDGELDEGSNWESILFAGHHRLGRLVCIVDFNKIQSLGRVVDVLALEPLADKFRAFLWNVIEVDGHNHEALLKALDFSRLTDNSPPTVIIAHTVKGKGVSFMEDRIEWHYRSPSDEQLAAALSELGAI